MTAPIRVAYLLWTGSLGGAERHVYDLAMALPRRRFAPTVCFLAQGETYGQLLAQAGVPVVEMGLRNGYDLEGALRFMRWLRQADLDLIHDHLSTPWARVAVGVSLPHAAVVSTEHSTLLLRGYGTWRRLWNYISARYTDGYIAVSEAVRDAFVRQCGVALNRVDMIPNFVDPARFDAVSGVQVRHVRRSLGIPDQATVLISIGRLIAAKGFDRLVNLLHPLFVSRPELHLLIVGDGPLRDTLVQQTENLQMQERIHVLGKRLDVPQLLAASDIFILASRVETFGIVAAEAMMAAKPVVASRIPGLDEVVKPGCTGILVDEACLETEFAPEVAGLLDDPELRGRMGSAGRKRATALYARDRVVKRIIQVYARVLDTKKRLKVKSG